MDNLESYEIPLKDKPFHRIKTKRDVTYEELKCAKKSLVESALLYVRELLPYLIEIEIGDRPTEMSLDFTICKQSNLHLLKREVNILKISPEIGDYCLSTKYEDGDVNEGFVIGYLTAFHDTRYVISDEEGVPFNVTGYRRAEVITFQEAETIFKNFSKEEGDVWKCLEKVRKRNA